jgi:predicted aspartyl protease
MRGPWTALLLAGALAFGLGGCEIETTIAAMPVRGDVHIAPTPTPSPGGRVSVPIRVINESGATLVLVPVKVNGHGPFEFILDTGASFSSVDRTLVRRLRLPHAGVSAHVQGIAGEIVVPVIRIGDWTVGGQPLHGRTMPVLDLGGDSIAGLLGSDELRQFGTVTVDYRRQRLILRSSGE